MPKYSVIQRWPLAKLKPHPRQAVLFFDLPDDQIRSLAKDMARNGQMEPVDGL